MWHNPHKVGIIKGVNIWNDVADYTWHYDWGIRSCLIYVYDNVSDHQKLELRMMTVYIMQHLRVKMQIDTRI